MRNFIKPTLFTVLAFFIFAKNIYAQKEDYIWLGGYDSFAGYDSLTSHSWGLSKLNFNSIPVTISYDSVGMNFSRTNTSCSDSNGNLLFYTNGIYIANSLDEKIENSDSMNWGAFISLWDPVVQQYGYRNPQGIAALPSPSKPNQFYLPHTFYDTIDNGNVTVTKLLYTLLDMSENAGHGKVLEKNITLLQDTIGWAMATVRHANGRDWWIIVQERETNCYYRFLLDPTGIHKINGSQCGGSNVIFNDLAIFGVSPDGSKIAHFAVYEGVTVFDFDRCNGEMTNPIFLPIPALADSFWFNSGAAISASNQFLYVAATTHVYQYDLWATNIDSSRVTVATYDGSLNPLGSYFSTMQYGADGKIYESCGNSEYVFHVIERPDEKGDSCLFMKHSFQLPSFCVGVPNFPNYRLGALVGSGCDTLNTDIRQETIDKRERQIRVFPNPASDVVTVDYGFTDWNKGEVRMEIINEAGQVVHEQGLPMYSGFQRVNVGGLASGAYQVFIKRGGQMVAVNKFTKQ